MPSVLAGLRFGNRGLAFSSSIAFAGLAVARLLGFLFSVAAARILAPADYGRVAYALAIAAMASVLLSSSPIGLSRFLARADHDRPWQNEYLSNWVAVVGLLLVASLLAAIPISVAGGLGGWMLVGVSVNLVGTAVLETYREAQRGLGRYGPQAIFYSLANLLQLIAIVVAAGLRWSSPALFVIIYGCSSVVAWVVMELAAPIGLSFLLGTLSMQRVLTVLRFIWPLVLQSVFFAVWFSVDLVLVQHMLPATATGNYAAAKTLANVVWMAPAAISIVLVPQVARLSENALRRRLTRIAAVSASVTLPVACGLALGGQLLIRATFGESYPDAAAPLALLGLGMALHGLYLVFFSIWVGLGRPVIDLVATAAGTTCTLAAAFILIPHGGLAGAAMAFGLGAALRLGVIVAFTAWSFSRRHSVYAGGTVAAQVPETPIEGRRRAGRHWSRWDGEAVDA